MPRLTWDQTGERLYETGTKRGVLFPQRANGTYNVGVAWNGLTAVTESPSGAEETALWADDMKYLSLRSAEEFGGTIECYTYPDEWGQCDGTATPATGVHIGQQSRSSFGLCYRTTVGNDTVGNDYGYKLHFVYNATASVSERAYATINDSPEAITFSYEFTTTPVDVKVGDNEYKPTSILTVDSTKCDPTILKRLEDIVYGTAGTVSYSTFSGESFAPGVTYYERTGTEGSYTYVPTADTEPQSGTTYYTKTETGGTDPRLPLPAEIIGMFAG